MTSNFTNLFLAFSVGKRYVRGSRNKRHSELGTEFISEGLSRSTVRSCLWLLSVWRLLLHLSGAADEERVGSWREGAELAQRVLRVGEGDLVDIAENNDFNVIQTQSNYFWEPDGSHTLNYSN